MSSQTQSGTVTSNTIIRVPGKANAAAAPFVLLLVECDGGRRLLGHFSGREAPPIGARVHATGNDPTPMFSLEVRS